MSNGVAQIPESLEDSGGGQENNKASLTANRFRSSTCDHDSC